MQGEKGAKGQEGPPGEQVMFSCCFFLKTTEAAAFVVLFVTYIDFHSFSLLLTLTLSQTSIHSLPPNLSPHSKNLMIKL